MVRKKVSSGIKISASSVLDFVDLDIFSYIEDDEIEFEPDITNILQIDDNCWRLKGEEK